MKKYLFLFIVTAMLFVQGCVYAPPYGYSSFYYGASPAYHGSYRPFYYHRGGYISRGYGGYHWGRGGYAGHWRR